MLSFAKMLKFGSAAVTRSLFVNFEKPTVAVVPAKKKSPDLLAQSVRYTGFYNRLTGKQLWLGVVSVSNAGKKKGRGRGGDKRNVRNLNVGQKIGVGKVRMNWPGLNVPIIKNREMQRISQNVQVNAETAATTPSPIKKKISFRIHPLDRGWSGKQQRGKKIGPPEPIEDETFEGFESIILENRLRSHMTSVLGRKRTFFSIVATGNGNGLIGIGRAKSIDSKTGISLARTRASKRLLTIDLIENNTVNHDFFTEYGRTKIFVFKKPQGYGLCCHRVIAALCKLVGIKDLRAKIDGAVNTIHIIRAFIIGLVRQKTYQQIADGSKLHLVEFRSDNKGFPRVMASPEKSLTLKEFNESPLMFEEYIMDGKLLYRPDKKVPFYKRLPSWTLHLRRTLFRRNHNLVKVNLISEYGALESHLTRIYPECSNRPKKQEKSESD